MDGQQWFNFAWSAQWAAEIAQGEKTDPDRPESPGKIFSQNLDRAVSCPGSLRPIGLAAVISIAPAGTITQHWQVKQMGDALKLGRYLIDRLPGETVRIRRTYEVVTILEVDEEIPVAGTKARRHEGTEG